jgi:4-hydroxybenzoyl-CoA thioesterase
MFENHYALTIEWGDCDPAGIVFYPRFSAMFDAATAALMEAASGLSRAALIHKERVLGWPMVESRIRFLAPCSFDERVIIHSQVSRVGRSSFSVKHRLSRGDILCVEGEDTRVWSVYGPEGGARVISRALPDELRRILLGEAA